MKWFNHGGFEIQAKKVDCINKQMNGTGCEIGMKNGEGWDEIGSDCIMRKNLESVGS